MILPQLPPHLSRLFSIWHQLEPAIPLNMDLEEVGLMQAKGFSFPQSPAKTLKELSGIKVMGCVRNSGPVGLLATNPLFPWSPKWLILSASTFA